MEKDDPMKNGIGQIKKSSMQAQQLVRRIIDLHRENPTNRVVHDLRMLLKDQMDLLEIIIPKNTRIKTNFGTETLPALIEETGFRQVVLNLAINAKDAVGKNPIKPKCMTYWLQRTEEMDSLDFLYLCHLTRVGSQIMNHGAPRIWAPLFLKTATTKGLFNV